MEIMENYSNKNCLKHFPKGKKDKDIKDNMDKPKDTGAGKGDKPRGGYNKTYRDNYDAIFRKKISPKIETDLGTSEDLYYKE